MRVFNPRTVRNSSRSNCWGQRQPATQGIDHLWPLPLDTDVPFCVLQPQLLASLPPLPIPASQTWTSCPSSSSPSLLTSHHPLSSPSFSISVPGISTPASIISSSGFPWEPSLQVQCSRCSVSITHPAPSRRRLLPQPVPAAAAGSDTSLLWYGLLQSTGGRKSNDREGNPAQIDRGYLPSRGSPWEMQLRRPRSLWRSRFWKFYDLAKGWVCGIDGRRCAPCQGGLIHTRCGHKSRLSGCANTLTGKTLSRVKQWHYFLTRVLEMAEPFLLI